MGRKFKMAAKHYYYSWFSFGKTEQTNIQIDGRYVTNSNSKVLFIFKADRMGTKFKMSSVLCVVGMKH